MNVIVIGGGPAGYAAAIRAAQLGAKVWLVEEKALGGTCLNVGCIPTKTLLEAVRIVSAARSWSDFGIKFEGISIDWNKLHARKKTVIKYLAEGLTGLLGRYGINVVRGRGRLLEPGRVAVTDEKGLSVTLTGDRVILALGSVPAKLTVPGADLPAVAYSQDALEWGEPPSELLVIGGGVIGVEFATLFAEAGSHVTIVEALPDILPTVEIEISRMMACYLKEKGVRVWTSARVIKLEPKGSKVSATVWIGTDETECMFDRVLVAVGRRPAVGDQGLEGTGIVVQNGKVVVNEYLETSVRGVYAAGDVIGGQMLAHVAFYEGVIAAENAVLGNRRTAGREALPYAVFTHPEIAGVGLTEAVARSKGIQVRVGRFFMAANGKAIIEGGGAGLVKVIAAEPYGRVVGVHIIGPHATEIIGEAALAIKLEATVFELGEAIHAHPTVAEAVGEACLATEKRAIHVAS